MGSGLWFITILKEQPWIGVAVGIILFFSSLFGQKLVGEKVDGGSGE